MWQVARVEAEACQRPDRSRKPDLLVPLIIEIPAWFSVWLRLYSRYRTVHRFEADDWIMLVCVIMNTPFLILGHYIGISCFGVDIWTVDADDLTQCLKLFYIDESFYVICLSLAKLSILCFFLRIFPNRVFRIITYSVMIFIGMSTTVFVFLQIFQCSPIEYNWLGWKGTFGSFRCLNVNTLVYTAAGFSIAQDVIILVLPLPLLFGLNMSWRSKMGIMVMFSLGIFILITSCIRLQYIVHFARSTNPTWDYTDTLIWTGLEVSVSMLVTSLPAIRMLVNRVIPDVLGTITSKYGFSFNSKKQVSGDSTDLRSGKYSDATYSNSVSGPSSRLAVPESRFKLFRVGGKGQVNESELELGDKLQGDVQTEIGATPSSWRDDVADQDRHNLSPDEVARNRITSHMNRAHSRELSHYLRHYANLSSRAASTPWLKDISLDAMTIAAGGLGGREFVIPFSPPLASLADARSRVIAMDADARKALGIRDVYVTAYEPPRGFDIVVFAAVAVYFLSYTTLAFVMPGTPFWRVLQAVFPGGPRSYRWLVKAIFWPVLGIHLGEVWWMHRSRLVPHGVDAGSLLWWQWIGTTFFEGACAFMRLDNVVAEKRKEKAAASH
ncbi:hypothetical protein ACHAPB_008072 [Verticillium nonalfalfae]